MKRVKKWVLIGLLVLLLIGTIILFVNKIYTYFIICFALTFVCFVALILSISGNKSDEEVYDINVNNTLKIYDAILVKSKDYPSLDGRNIIYVEEFDDLVDAQLEIRKPVYYVREESCCSFILLDTQEALIYIMKKDPNVNCKLEEMINGNNDEKKEESIPKGKDDLLADINNTTILKISDDRKFKISPFGNKEEISTENVEENTTSEVKNENENVIVNEDIVPPPEPSSSNEVENNLTIEPVVENQNDEII